MKSTKRKILILNSIGMAGHMISNYLETQEKYSIVNVVFNPMDNKSGIYVDLEDKYSLKMLIDEKKPDTIINCIRVLIEESESNPSKAIYLNSFIPKYLEQICLATETKIIQLSTDCVFSGLKGNYIESDIKDGDSNYARTKALGELNNSKDLTIRTSYIGPNVGSSSEELFHWFMMQQGEIMGYSNVFWTGVTTLELAKSIDTAIQLDLTGLYHLVPKEKISKYDLLCLIREIWAKDNIKIQKYEKVVLDKSLVDNRKEIEVSNYTVMLEELYDWMSIHKDQYEKYMK